MNPDPVSISVRNVAIRFPLYGVDAKSLKKHLARVAVGGRRAQGGARGSQVTALRKIKN